MLELAEALMSPRPVVPGRDSRRLVAHVGSRPALPRVAPWPPRAGGKGSLKGSREIPVDAEEEVSGRRSQGGRRPCRGA